MAASTTPAWNTKLANGTTMRFVDAQTAIPVVNLATKTDNAYLVTAEVIAVADDNYDEVNAYVLFGAFKNDGGTLAQSGSTNIDTSIEGHGGWAATFATSGTNIQVVFTTDDTTPVTVRARLSVLMVGKDAPHAWGNSDNQYYKAS